jgi:hypothetical protein
MLCTLCSSDFLGFLGVVICFQAHLSLELAKDVKRILRYEDAVELEIRMWSSQACSRIVSIIQLASPANAIPLFELVM